MAYIPTDWKNKVYDSEGNMLQEGTPLSAENMNKIERKLSSLDEDQHAHENKDVLDKVKQTHLDRAHEHENKELLDTVKPENVHSHENKVVLDNLSQQHLDQAHTHNNKILLDRVKPENVHAHENKDVLDKVEQTHLDRAHEHENKELLDTVKPENVHSHGNMAALNQVSQAHLDNIHIHENKELLDSIKLENVHAHENKTAIDALTQKHLNDSHSHTNWSVLDKVKQSHLDDILSHGLILNDHEQRLVNLVESLTNMKIKVVQNIADRDSSTNKDSIFHVIDASGDPTVISGWAQYIYQDKWIKIAENESIDVVLKWANIVDKPLTYLPSTHVHTIAQITGLQAELEKKESVTEAQAKANTAETNAKNHANNLYGMRILDNRAVVPKPADYDPGRTTQEFKLSSSVGLSSLAGTYVHVFTERAWNDASGGYVHQLAYDGLTTKIWTRYGNQSTNVWSGWDQLETTRSAQEKVNAHANDKETHVDKDDRLLWDDAADKAHIHSNKETLDKLTQSHLDEIAMHESRLTSLEDSSNQLHVHSNKAVLDKLTQTHLDNSHSHANKEVLDTLTQNHLNQAHDHSNKVVLDKLTQSHLDEIAMHESRLTSLEDSSNQLHVHSNKAVLDKLNQTHIDNSHTHTNKIVLDALTQNHLNQAHAHSNKAVLDTITQTQLNNIHTHENKAALDKISYTGSKTSIDLIKLDELENHTHDYNKLQNKPSIPSKTSDLSNDSQFVQSNASRIHISYSDTDIPLLQVNDIVIKVL